jgi:hypothetical protein
MLAMAGFPQNATIEDPTGPICRHRESTEMESVVREDEDVVQR